MPRWPLYDEPLPKCKGPKLHPFQDRTAVIDFVRLISDQGPSDTSEGGHAHVFEVSILSKTYALKMFKFYDDEDDRAALIGEERDLIPVEILRAHRDPFFNECRAYGRLVEKNLNGKVAVRCYGYVTVPAEWEEELRRKFEVDNWNRPHSEYAKAPTRRQPFRAILKDLVTKDVPFTEKVVRKMLKDLKRIRGVGVYPMDIVARNYRGGLLLDFSAALTEPHYLFVIKPRWRVRVYKRDDLISWQSLVKDEGVDTWERAVPNVEYCKKLRSRNSKNKGAGK
ncbi:MAG: hypothetical protein Q9217_002898 [Psora testacea]